MVIDLPSTGSVELEVFNVRGQLVRTLVAEVKEAGQHAFTWDGRDASGRRVSAGSYLVRLRAGTYELTRRVIHVR
jgi:flagellar hook assembly protein FlgD